MARSRRFGFNNYVIGQLFECAKVFYNISIKICIHEDLSDHECELLLQDNFNYPK